MVQSLAGATLSIAITTGTTPDEQTSLPLDSTGFAALTWLDVGGVGSLPELGSTTNVLSYDTLDTTVTQKAAGVTDGGGGDIEIARNATDNGQIAMRTAGLTANNHKNYAFKITHANGDVQYNAGLLFGPRQPGGRVEDFVLEIFTFAANQEQVVVDA